MAWNWQWIRVRLAAAMASAATLLVASSAMAAPPSLQTAEQAASLPACQQAAVTLDVIGSGDPVAERLPLDVMVVFDRSGSMVSEPGGQPLAAAKSAANLLIGNLDPGNDLAGLTSFSSSSTLNAPLTLPFAAVTAAVNGLSASGSTNIAGGVLAGQNEIAAHGRAAPAVHVMVVLSDGVANVAANGTSCPSNPTSPNTCTTDAVNKAAAAKAAGTIVFSIGLNLDNITPAVANVARSTLQAIATDAAKYYGSPSPGDLAAIFQDIATQVTNLAGSNVVVTDVLPAGVSYVAGSASPAPSSVSGQTLTWNLGIVSIGQTSSITFHVALDTGDPDQLVGVSPDSRVDYTNYQGNTASVPFPQTLVSVLPCATATPSDTMTAIATDTATETSTPTPSATPTVTVAPPPTGCPLVARSSCRTAQKALLRIKNSSDDGRDKLLWKWIKGQQTAVADLGDPVAGTSYKLCLYAGADEHLISDGEIVLLPGTGWTTAGAQGFMFRDKSPTAADGSQKVSLFAGADGRARVKVLGRGANLPDPALPFAAADFPVVVQMINAEAPAVCFESRFAQALRNSATQLKLKTP